MLERLFMPRIRSHVETSTNFNRFQSAYRCAHSTETALLRMLNDVYDTADNQSRSLVMRLDLSAAFDMLVMKTLLRRLDHTFGVRGKRVKGKASSLDKAPLTILNSGALQPRKWQLTGNDCSTAAQAVAAQSPRLRTIGPTVCSQQAYYAPINHARPSSRNRCS